MAKCCAPSPSFIFIFDFDRTLTHSNSDETIIAQLGLQEQFEPEKKKFCDAYFARQRVAGKKANGDDLHQPFSWWSAKGQGLVQNEFSKRIFQPTEPYPTCASGVEIDERFVWSDMMQPLLAPCSVDEIKAAAVKSVTVHPDMVKVVQRIDDWRKAKRQGTFSDADAKTMRAVQLHVVSDANAASIEAVFEAIFRTKPDAICSNLLYRCEVNGEKQLKLDWMSPESHHCPRCRRLNYLNICKGRVVENILRGGIVDGAEQCKYLDGNGPAPASVMPAADPTVVFIGDGFNDHCAVAHLRARDIAFIRRNHSMHKTLNRVFQSQRGKTEPTERVWPTNDEYLGVVANIVLWNDAPELLQQMELFGLLPSPSNSMSPIAALPPLMLFGDVDPPLTPGHASALPFRHVTRQRRMPQLIRHTISSFTKAGACSNAETEARLTRLERLAKSVEGNEPVPLPADISESPKETLLTVDFSLSRANDVGGLIDNTNTRTAWLQSFAGLSANDGTGDQLVWSDLPWLSGEIYFHHCINAIWQSPHSKKDNNTTIEVSAQPFFAPLTNSPADRPPYQCPQHIPATEFSATLDYEKNISASGRSGTQSPWWDVFGPEKLKAVESMLLTHIFPMLAATPAWVFNDSTATVDREEAVAAVRTALRQSLWGNRADLCLKPGESLQHIVPGGSPLTPAGTETTSHVRVQEQRLSLEQLDRDILTNHIPDIAEHLVQGCLSSVTGQIRPRRALDIIVDNTGIEVASDLMLALILVRLWSQQQQMDNSSSIKKTVVQGPVVRLLVKPMGFYVSDVTPHDIVILLNLIFAAAANTQQLSGLEKTSGRKFCEWTRKALCSGALEVVAYSECVSPTEFRELGSAFFDLFGNRIIGVEWEIKQSDLSSSSLSNSSSAMLLQDQTCTRGKLPYNFDSDTNLVLVKGDLNFRRLAGDRLWPRGVDLATCLSDYWPRRDSCNGDDLLLEKDSSDKETSPVSCSTVKPLLGLSVAALRTMKSELVVGVPESVIVELDKGDESKSVVDGWRVNGNLAVALFHKV